MVMTAWNVTFALYCKCQNGFFFLLPCAKKSVFNLSWVVDTQEICLQISWSRPICLFIWVEQLPSCLEVKETKDICSSIHISTRYSSLQACIDGSMEVVSFLLAQGANVNQVDSEGWTPLHVAASCGNLEITEYVTVWWTRRAEMHGLLGSV